MTLAGFVIAVWLLAAGYWYAHQRLAQRSSAPGPVMRRITNLSQLRDREGDPAHTDSLDETKR